jgi:hypothetical protein
MHENESFNRFVESNRINTTEIDTIVNTIELKWVQTNLLEIPSLNLKMVYFLVDKQNEALKKGIYMAINRTEEELSENEEDLIETIRTISITNFLEPKNIPVGDYDLEQYMEVEPSGTLRIEGEEMEWTYFHLTHNKAVWSNLRGQEEPGASETINN